MKKLYGAKISVERDFNVDSDFTIQLYEYPILKEKPEYYVILLDNQESIVFKDSKEPSVFPTKIEALEALANSFIRQSNVILQQIYTKKKLLKMMHLQQSEERTDFQEV